MATPITQVDVRTAANTQVLTGTHGEYDAPTIWVKIEGSQKHNGGPVERQMYNITFHEAGSPQNGYTFKGYFAGVGYEFKKE